MTTESNQWRLNEFESGALVRSESGCTDPARIAGKNFLVVVSLHFLALKAQ